VKKVFKVSITLEYEKPMRFNRNLKQFMIILALAMPVALGAMEIQRWDTHDFTFKSSTEHENPFMVDFAAEVTGPDGLKFTQLGFYAGDGTWKIRLGPNTPGKWSLRTRSSDAQLNGKKTAGIICVEQKNPRIHGGLLSDPEHIHHFVREDGTRFFYSGFECDWLWAVDLESCDPAVPQTKIMLDKLVANDFNVVYMNTYAHTGFASKDQQPNFGPPPKYAWGGSNEQPDHSVLNLAFWQNYDRVIKAMWERGLEAHIMIKVYNKHVKWPAIGSPEDDMYFKNVIARYGAFCNVHWDFSKESNNEKNLEYKLGRFDFIHKNDPYRRLLTTHTDHQLYTNFIGILDYRTDQNHTNYHKTALRQRSHEPWPVVNSEYGYEQGPLGAEDKTYRGANDAETIIKRAWEVYMAGAYGAYYYTFTSWDVVRVNDTPKGYGYYKNLASFFNQAGLWSLEPNDALVNTGHCLANPGREYVVYQPEPKEFTITVAGAAKPLAASWFNPLTGRMMKTEDAANGQKSFVPPSGWGGGPIVLHLGTAPAYKTVFRNTFKRALPSKGSVATSGSASAAP
jgi:hypothetical protein